MRAARAVVALFVLLSVVLGTSANAPARGRGDSQVMSCDDTADPPACTCAPPIAVRPLRAWSVFELAPIADPGDVRRVEILTSAPKTSPPAV